MNDQYVAFLLRLWRVGEGEDAAWRASLEDPHSGEVRAFAGLEALVAFLEARIEGQDSSRAGSWPSEGGGD